MQNFLQTSYDFRLLKKWEDDEATRIGALTDEALVTELVSVMSGQIYSWSSIKKGLQSVGIVNFALHRRWNILWDRKCQWEAMCKDLAPHNTAEHIFVHLSEHGLWNRESYQRLALNLKVIPIRAGLGKGGIELVNSNIDKAPGCNEHSRSWDLSEWCKEDPGDDERTPLLG